MAFSANPFSLLAGQEDGDVSDTEVPKPAPKPAQPAATTTSASSGRGAGRGQAKSTEGAAAPRRSVVGQTTNRQPRAPAAANDAAAAAGTDGPAPFDGERGRDDRSAAPRGAGRGPRGGGRGDNKDRKRGTGERRGGPNGPRLDRRSATGRVDSEKQEHQGWGGDEGKRELEAENAGVSDAAAEKKVDATGGETVPETPTSATQAEPDKAAAAAPEVPAEPEDTSLTYEEYLKQQKAAGRGALDSIAAKEERKANEGQDDSQWKDGVLVPQEENTEDIYFLGGTKEKASKQRERKQKTHVEVEFTSPPVRGPSERGGRGGRGRGEGRGGAPRGAGGPGRGRGGAPRGGAPRGASRPNGSQAFNVDDNKAFPSLS